MAPGFVPAFDTDADPPAGYRKGFRSGSAGRSDTSDLQPGIQLVLYFQPGSPAEGTFYKTAGDCF